MKSSIRISQGGNRIRFTGDAANEFFKSINPPQPPSELYIFHREGGFYPLELKDDSTAIENAKSNPGTLKVTNGITNKVVWQLPTKFKSIAVWPKGTVEFSNDVSEDTHGSRAEAEGICKLLRQNGFGGDGQIFPLETRVEEVK